MDEKKLLQCRRRDFNKQLVRFEVYKRHLILLLFTFHFKYSGSEYPKKNSLNLLSVSHLGNEPRVRPRARHRHLLPLHPHHPPQGGAAWRARDRAKMWLQNWRWDRSGLPKKSSGTIAKNIHLIWVTSGLCWQRNLCYWDRPGQRSEQVRAPGQWQDSSTQWLRLHDGDAQKGRGLH